VRGKGGGMALGTQGFTPAIPYLQEMWMPLDSIVNIWSTDYNKYYTANSGGTATYSSSVFDRINDYMTQM
jgi:hypothetical protein